MTTIKGSLIPQSTDNLPPSKLSVLYVGAPKSGKTHCTCTWPKPLVLYWDKNLATIKKFPGVEYVQLDSWKEFKQEVVPLIQNREWPNSSGELVPFPYSTLVLDSASTLFETLLRELQKIYKGFDLWNMVYAEFLGTMRVLVRLATPDNSPTSPTANVVVACHTRDRENEAGNIVKITPDLAGQSKDAFPRLFDTILLCSRTTSGASNELKTESHVYTVNPNSRFDFVGDGVGGGKNMVLPPKTGGTYPELCKAWGLEKEN